MTDKTMRVLSIDAWRSSEGGWDWNNWFHVTDLPLSWADWPVRKLLFALRREGLLSATSAGKVAIEDDGYNVVIKDRSSDEPLYALEYGACDR